MNRRGFLAGAAAAVVAPVAPAAPAAAAGLVIDGPIRAGYIAARAIVAEQIAINNFATPQEIQRAAIFLSDRPQK